MCGIIGAANFNKNKEPVNEWVINQFEDQKSRGMQGFGIVAVQDDGTFKVLRATEPAKAIIDLYMNSARFIIMHHRIPTSSDNKIKQTHPIFVSHKDFKYSYLVIHNGIISNDRALKEQHEKEGFQYTTEYVAYANYVRFNDSESVAIELAKFIEGKTKKMESIGSAAVIALQINEKTGKVEQLFFVRNDGNPLNMAKKEGQIRLSSEGPGEEIKTDMLYSCNMKDWKLHKRECIMTERTIPVASVANYGKHSTYCQCASCQADIAEFDEYNMSYSVVNKTADDITYDADSPYEATIDIMSELLDDLMSEVANEMDDRNTLPYIDIKDYAERFERILEDAKSTLIKEANDETLEESTIINTKEEAYDEHISKAHATTLPI